VNESPRIRTINYEQPLNERMRTFLRYEQLTNRFEFFAKQERSSDTHAALLTLIEVLNLVSRGDLKQELLKEVKRQINALELLANKPKVNTVKLNRILSKHKSIFDELHAFQGQINDHLKNNVFLNSIRQRASIPGGTCDFDLPEYHHWLGQPYMQRNKVLKDWAAPFEVFQKGISQSLQLVRQSSQPKKNCASKGFFSQTLDSGRPCQLVRINVVNTYFPECSAGKQRFSVRFFEQTSLNLNPKQTKADVEFKLACCSF